jgi:hypothetical protein
MYDCGIHMVSELAAQHQYQYVPAHNPDCRAIVRKDTVLRLYIHLATLYSPDALAPAPTTPSPPLCSPHCYKQLTR